MKVDIVTFDSDFEALKPGWEAIAHRLPGASAFLTHAWFDAAWAWRRHDSMLYILCARKGEHNAGILPLIRSGKHPRRLEFLTVPDAQLCDLIAAPEDLGEVADAFARKLAGAQDWDTLYLDSLAPEGACVRALVPALARQGLDFAEQNGGSNSFIALNGNWNDYYNTRSRSLKKANNLAANRLKKAGTIRIEWLGPNARDELQLERALGLVIEISRSSWKHSAGTALDRPGPNAFIRKLSQSAYDRGWLSLWLLYVDERPVAMEYQLVYEGNIHALRSDFDQNYDAISPGSHLFRQLLERLFGVGQIRYYMGRGDNPYKKRWTDDSQPVQRIIVYNRTLRGRIAHFNETLLKPIFRGLRDRMPLKRNVEQPTTKNDLP